VFTASGRVVSPLDDGIMLFSNSQFPVLIFKLSLKCGYHTLYQMNVKKFVKALFEDFRSKDFVFISQSRRAFSSEIVRKIMGVYEN
jgi:hypothetical protein